MDADRGRLLSTFFALLARGAALAADYDDNHPDFKVRVLWLETVTACSAPLRPPHPASYFSRRCLSVCPPLKMGPDHLDRFAHRWLLFSAVWGFGSSLPNDKREELGRLLVAHSTVSLPPGTSLVDLQPRVSG